MSWRTDLDGQDSLAMERVLQKGQHVGQVKEGREGRTGDAVETGKEESAYWT